MITYNKKQDYSYIAYNLNNEGYDSDDFFFTSGSNYTIKKFSIPDQEITEYGVDELINEYAVSDEYLFFSTNGETKDAPQRIWKYDRLLETYEVFLEVPKCVFMEVCEGFLLWGDGYEICAVPVDGNPEKDCVSILELFGEDGLDSEGSGEVSFLGWKIRRYPNGENYWSWDITDQQTGNIIEGGIFDHRQLLYVDDVKVEFSRNVSSTESYFNYRRDGEDDWHEIHCLDGRKYNLSYLDTSCMVLENNMIFALLTVASGSQVGRGLSQYNTQSDVLFVINLDTDTSSIVFDTQNNETRIIGYREGILFLLENDIIYRKELRTGRKEKLYDFGEEGWVLYKENDEHEKIHKSVYFEWQGNNLIMWTDYNNMRSINVSD